MPLPTTFAGVSARSEGLFSSQKIGAQYWVGVFQPTLSGAGNVLPTSYAVDSTGNIYVCAQDQASSFSYLIKISSSGTLLWQIKLIGNSGGFFTAYNIKIAASGNIYLFGVDQGYASSPGGTGVIMKLNSFGTYQWSTIVSTSTSYYGMVLDSSENIYTARGDYTGYAYVAKTDLNGNLINYAAVYGAYASSLVSTYSTSINLDSSGNVYINGTMSYGRTGNSRVGYNYLSCCFLAKFDSSLNLISKYQSGVINLFNGKPSIDSSGNIWTSGGGSPQYLVPNGTDYNQYLIYGYFSIVSSTQLATDTSGNAYFSGVSAGGVGGTGGYWPITQFKINSGPTAISYGWSNYFDTNVTFSYAQGYGPWSSPHIDSVNNKMYFVGVSQSSGNPVMFITVLPTDGTHTGWTKSFGSTTISYNSSAISGSPTVNSNGGSGATPHYGTGSTLSSTTTSSNVTSGTLGTISSLTV